MSDCEQDRRGARRAPGRARAVTRRSDADAGSVQGPPFDFIASKVRAPVVRPDSVSRTGLVNRLRAMTSSSIVVLAAPAGYGKTTLLAQWAMRDERPFAWVTIDSRDNDPVILLRHLAIALGEVGPVDRSALDALVSPGPTLWRVAVPRLAAVVASLERPFVMVLDGADLLESEESVDAVSTLADQIPEGSLLVVAGRAAPRLRIARLRASGRLFEIGPDMLALSRREAHLLLRASGVELADAEVAELVRRTEGWPAGLSLAGLSMRGRNGADGSVSITGEDRYVAEYLRSEPLSDLTADTLAFLRRSSVLGAMCGSLCDAALETENSGSRLESMRESNLFLVPLDDHGEWYRYHHLLEDLLRHDLAQREGEQIPGLNQRAADWYEAHGELEAALDPAAESGDPDRVARIFGSVALRSYHGGHLTTIEGWLDYFADEAQLARYPNVGALGSWIHALRGRRAVAEKWLLAAQAGSDGQPVSDGSVPPGPCIAVLRAAMCRDGVEQMMSDAQDALLELPEDSQWRPAALVLHGVVQVLLGDDEHGDLILAMAAEEAERLEAHATRLVALSERSLVAAYRGDHSQADALAFEARDLAKHNHLDDYPTSAVTLAACARALIRQGRWDEARAHLTAAHHLSRSLTDALPWLAVQARLELASAHVTLRDADSARTLLAEVDRILDGRAQLGVLAEQRATLSEQIDTMSLADGNASGLTSAELRVLPLLTTHLTFREIGGRLFVSRNTIKTQAISIYRKLGVCGRSEAIERAYELGLIDPELHPASADFIRSG